MRLGFRGVRGFKRFRGEGGQPLRGWGLWPPAAAGCVERGHGPSGRELWYRPRAAKRPGFRRFKRFRGFRGFRGEGIAFGDEYKVSVTGLAFVSPLLRDIVQKPHSLERNLRSEFPPVECKKRLHKKSSRKIFRDGFYFIMKSITQSFRRDRVRRQYPVSRRSRWTIRICT